MFLLPLHTQPCHLLQREDKGHIAWTGLISCCCTNNLYLQPFPFSSSICRSVRLTLSLILIQFHCKRGLFHSSQVLSDWNAQYLLPWKKSRSKTKHPPLPTFRDQTPLYTSCSVSFPSQILWIRCFHLFCKCLKGTVGYSLVPDSGGHAQSGMEMVGSITREPMLCCV